MKHNCKKRLQNLKSLLRQVIKTSPCPQCGVAIQKTGGCQHMICPKCHYEFCWTCRGYYPSYMHEPNMNLYHKIARFFKTAIPILLIVFLVVKLLYISNPTFSFKNTERVLDSLTKGQSIFTSYHMLVIFLAWITIHIYLVITVIFGFGLGYKIKRLLGRIGCSKKLLWIYIVIYVTIVLATFSHVKFGCLSLQVLLFEVCCIIFVPTSFLGATAVMILGVISLIA
jgi:hypothetical protein